MKKNYLLLMCFAFSFCASAQTYTFTNAGASGPFGPDQTTIDAAYTGTNLDGDVIINTQGIQEWIVPVSGNYSFEVIGASGGMNTTYSGHGANVYGELSLTAGTTLYILVGQMGSQLGSNQYSEGGGGASFITDGTDLLFTAGGGGGAAQVVNNHQDASLLETVISGVQTHFGSAGAGYLADGVQYNNSTSNSTVAQSFVNGGTGHIASLYSGAIYGEGGFGGGGNSCACNTGGGGGGGGYLGGGGGGGAFTYGPYPSGYGGSSYTALIASNVSTQVSPALGHGQVVITKVCDPLVTSISADTVCFGEEVILNAESSNGGTISWDNGILGNVPFTPAVGTVLYTATSSNIDDCPFEAEIVTYGIPTVGAGMDINLCTAQDTLLYGTGASSYTWTNGITDSVQFTPVSGFTVYTVTGVDTNGCENTATVNVTIGGPVLSATITNEVTSGDGAIDLNVIGGTGTYTYNWSNGATTQDISGLITGPYSVEVNDGVCESDSTFSISNVAGISNSSVDNFNLYPNPSKDIVTITFEGQFTYYVFNILGEIVATASVVDKETLDLSSLKNGVYFVEVSDGEKKQTVKLIKQ
ncbi:MAG: glycine-rich protein [Crocinitomicaceae bacterium]|nr:glycine-rich protein [Crocinitomicaceae bacterium]